MKKILFTIALLAVSAAVLAQEYSSETSRDAKLNTGFEVGCRLSPRWRLVWGEEFYFMNDGRDFDRLYSRVTLSYNLTEHLRIAPMALLINIRSKVKTENVGVFDLNVYYTRRLGRMSLTLREAVRTKFLGKTYDPLLRSNPEVMLRTHVAANYALTDRIAPFANAEVFNMLNAPQAIPNFYLQRLRTNVGVKYAFDSRNAVSLFWRYDLNISKRITLAEDGSLTALHTKHAVDNMLGIFYYCSF